jgi:lambda repressor-like predicted transcriptional regulator
MTTTQHTCPPDHAHGDTLTCHNRHGCRDDECRNAYNAHRRALRRAAAYGTTPKKFIDAGPVRDHIAALRAQGMSRRDIATAAGLHLRIINDLLYGRWTSGGSHAVRYITRAMGERVLATEMNIAVVSDGSCVPALGTHRRIQALMANGWSIVELGARSGTDIRCSLWRPTVTARSARAVAELFELLWDQQPPRNSRYERMVATRTIAYAARRNWPRPLAWDDIDTDTSPAEPETADDYVDEIAVALALRGQRVTLNRAERHIVVARYHALRWPDPRIAELTGVRPETIYRDRHHLGLHAFPQNQLVKRDAA